MYGCNVWSSDYNRRNAIERRGEARCGIHGGSRDRGGLDGGGSGGSGRTMTRERPLYSPPRNFSDHRCYTYQNLVMEEILLYNYKSLIFSAQWFVRFNEILYFQTIDARTLHNIHVYYIYICTQRPSIKIVTLILMASTNQFASYTSVGSA